MFDRLNFKPLILSSSAPSSAAPSPTEPFSKPQCSSPVLKWRNSKKSLIGSADESGSSSGSPVLGRKNSPVESVVNFLGDVKRDLELSLRFRDIFILGTTDKFLMLQV